MNIVAVDPSLSCTAMVVNDKKFVYTSESMCLTKKGEFTNWFKMVDDFGLATIRVHDNLPKMDHSLLEVYKLRHFHRLAHTILEDIGSALDLTQPVRVGIEGYSYSSAAGPLIDLVTLGTFIRHNLSIFGQLEVYQPTVLKQKAAQLTYPATLKKGSKKDLEWRNNEGVAGGSFKKPEIMKSLIENSNLNCDWVNFLRGCSEEVLGMKSIPKPLEDINDAKMLYEIMKASQ